MRCSMCNSEIREGDEKCGLCGGLPERNDSQKSASEAGPGQKAGQSDKAVQVWWKYSVFSDKSIDRLDQILFFIYIGFAFYIPLSVLVSLIIIHLVRNKEVNDVYRKAATVVIVGIAVFSMVVNFVRHSPK
jgi:hypothetical protein